MKLIIAIVRSFTVEKIVTAFEDIEDFPGMTITDSEGFGRGPRSAAYDALDPFKPYKRIEIVCESLLCNTIVEVLREHSHTGKKGDGIIFVQPVEQLVAI
jgi:nitrogen regulatory protein PII